MYRINVFFLCLLENSNTIQIFVSTATYIYSYFIEVGYGHSYFCLHRSCSKTMGLWPKGAKTSQVASNDRKIQTIGLQQDGAASRLR